MLKWKTEFHKNLTFIVAILLWIIVVFALYLALPNNEVVSIIWIFSVILSSCACIFYSGFSIYRYLSLKQDTLLQLATITNNKKASLKTTPLALVTTIVGLFTLTAYLLAGETSIFDTDTSATELCVLYLAKIISVAGFILLVWDIAAAVKNIFNLGAKIFVFGLIFLVAMVLYFTVFWLVASIGQEWFIGVSDNYIGIPVYVSAIPVIVLSETSLSTLEMNLIGIALNLIPILIFLAICLKNSLTHSRSPRN